MKRNFNFYFFIIILIFFKSCLPFNSQLLPDLKKISDELVAKSQQYKERQKLVNQFINDYTSYLQKFYAAEIANRKSMLCSTNFQENQFCYQICKEELDLQKGYIKDFYNQIISSFTPQEIQIFNQIIQLIDDTIYETSLII